MANDETDYISENYEYETDEKDNAKILKLLAEEFGRSYKIKTDRAIEILKDYDRVVEIFAIDYEDEIKIMLEKKVYGIWRDIKNER